MIFGAPSWFWLGLVAIIPVLIHLWNKKSGKPRLLGTFRFLPEDSFASAKKIELHEIPLMLVRILMVALVVLLLAELLLEDEIEGVERVIISETPTGEYERSESEDGIEIVSFSSKEIQQKGWWDIFEQIEYQQQPDRITIRGDFSEINFKGMRPTSGTIVDWQPVDSLYADELLLAVWKAGDEEYKALVQRRTEFGIRTYVEEIQPAAIENAEMKVIEAPNFILNSENKETLNLGFAYTADSWGIEVREQPLTALARIEIGNQTIRLSQVMEDPGVQDMVEANSTFGISLGVKGMKANVQPQKEIVISRDESTPFIYIDSKGDLVINGEVEKELESWVIAAIANRMLMEAFGVNDFLTPELKETQRDPAAGYSRNRDSIPTEQREAKLWLMSLLALCWLTERWLAPRRGM